MSIVKSFNEPKLSIRELYEYCSRVDAFIGEWEVVKVREEV